MNREIVQIYIEFDKNSLTSFFENLLNFIKKYDETFKLYVFKDSLEAIEKFQKYDFYLGTTDDNIEGLALFYSEEMLKATEKEICGNVIHMIWDVATFRSAELCPSCQDSNLKIASSTDQNNIYKTCDNCLITLEKGKFIERPEEMIPATRKQVDYLLKNDE